MVANYQHLLLALAVSGCVGSLVEPPGGEGNNGTGPGAGGGGNSGGAGGVGAAAGMGAMGPGTNPADPRYEARAWRLTPTQYNGEVQRFFPGAPAVDLPVGGSEYGLTNIASSARIDTGNATQYS